MLCEGFGDITPPPAEGSAGTFLIASTVKVLFGPTRAIAGFRVQRANRYTRGPADGSDRTRDLSLGSAGRDQVLQLTVSGA